ncbi:galactokinase [Dispira simplex]|nr:galactokinase [Dispira simplex]
MQPDKFPACEFTHAVGQGTQVPIDTSQLEWSNYFKCGYRGILRLLASHSLSMSLPDGYFTLCCLVDGDIPVGAGLSSSSAFVSCAVITTLMAYGHDKEVDQRSITQVAIRSERDIGVNSGGMDQTCSTMAQPQSALFIEFQPQLDAIPVPVPRVVPSLTFVIANSLATSAKFVTASTCYNLRWWKPDWVPWSWQSG